MIVEHLGLVDYAEAYEKMTAFTANRQKGDEDRLWLLQHPPIFTLGKSGKIEHLLNPHSGIPLARTDRGGQITYHGPGQLVAYCLVDVARLGGTTHRFVTETAGAVQDVLAARGVQGDYDDDRPGVYVNGKKICSLGFRIRRGCSYHGLALNVDNDLAPFDNIDPCGYAGLRMTRLKDLIDPCPTVDETGDELARFLAQRLSAWQAESETRANDRNGN